MASTRFDAHDLAVSGASPVRRRWLAVAVILAVAFAGALLGQMSTVRHDAARPTPPGPLDALPF